MSAVDESVEIFVKTTGGLKVPLELESDMTIEDVKQILSCMDELPVNDTEHQTILFKGKVCADQDTIADIGIKNGESIIVLRGKLKESAKKEEKKERKIENKEEKQQDLMSQLMSSPMMQGMMQNTDLLSSVFNSSPALKELLKENPQLRHVLKDPSLMQHALKAATNQDYMNEMLRNNDRALANIESMPGGFSALSRMYSQIQQPIESAMDDVFKQKFGMSKTVVSQVDKTNGPTKQPMENPWNEQKTHGTDTMQSMMQMMSMNTNTNTVGTNNDNYRQMFSNLYANQLATLQSMGYFDQNANLNALIATGGNVDAAINFLVRSRSKNKKSSQK